MKIKKVTVEGFGSFYDRTTFVFRDQGVVLVEGANGAGKSYLFDSIDWGLFGKPPRGGLAQSVISDGQAQCCVSVFLDSGDFSDVEITRSRSASGASLHVVIYGKKYEYLDIAQTQALVERVLGFDRTAFRSAVYFAQQDLVHFAAATDAARMEILTHLLGLDAYNDFRKITKEHLQKTSEDLASVHGSLVEIEASLSSVPDYTEKKLEWEHHQASKIMDLEHRRDQFFIPDEPTQQELGSLQKAVSVASSNLDLLKSGPAQPSQYLMDQVSMLTIEVRGYRDQIARAQQVLQGYQGMHEAPCPTCGQPVSPATKATLIGQASQSVSYLQHQLEASKASLQTAENALATERQGLAAQYQAQKERSNELITAATEARRNLDQWHARKTQVAQARKQREQLEQTIKQVRSEKNPYVEIEYKEQQRAQNLEMKRVEYRKAEGRLEKQKRALEFWKVAFGPKGVRSYILDHWLGLLNAEIGKFINLLTGGSISVQLVAQKQGATGKVTNAPTLIIRGVNKDGSVFDRPFRQWSGGERQRISFAVDLALAQSLNSTQGIKSNILVLDEVFRHLDTQGKQAIVDMIDLLAKGRAVYVIDHDVEVKARFTEQVVVTKQDNKSTIRVTHGEACEREKTKAKKKSVVRTASRKARPKRQAKVDPGVARSGDPGISG
jgi:DNA repair exonuclease SbcCD ATPase subunit